MREAGGLPGWDGGEGGLLRPKDSPTPGDHRVIMGEAG